METLDFPLIYCNGDSYSDQSYHPDLRGQTYDQVVAEYFGGFALNKSIMGSSNRRIIRTCLHDILLQRQINPRQQIIVLLGLTFDLRSEIWIENVHSNNAEESNFRTHTFSNKLTWREDLLSGKDIESVNRYHLDSKHFDKYSQGRAYFFSPYAERINLFADLLMLQTTFAAQNVDFLIFQSPPAEKLGEEYLLDFFKDRIKDDERFYDLEEFSFCNWSHSQGFVPLDFLDRPQIGHYGPDAHRAFAEKILIPKIQHLFMS